MSKYRSVAVAELFYDPANFAVGEPIPRARQPFDQNKITWEWIITPKKSLNQTINLLIEAQWEPINDSGPAATPNPHPIWRSPLEIQVVPSPFEFSLAFTPFALNLPNLVITSLIGSILNIPLFVQWGKKMMKQ